MIKNLISCRCLKLKLIALSATVMLATALMEIGRTNATSKPAMPEAGMLNVSPVGWRRTVNGWELAENWGMPSRADRSINQWISVQNQQEASFARTVLDRMRLVHPLVYSTMLVVIVATIAMLHERSNRLRSRHAISSPATSGR